MVGAFRPAAGQRAGGADYRAGCFRMLCGDFPQRQGGVPGVFALLHQRRGLARCQAPAETAVAARPPASRLAKRWWWLVVPAVLAALLLGVVVHALRRPADRESASQDRGKPVPPDAVKPVPPEEPASAKFLGRWLVTDLRDFVSVSQLDVSRTANGLVAGSVAPKPSWTQSRWFAAPDECYAAGGCGTTCHGGRHN